MKILIQSIFQIQKKEIPFLHGIRALAILAVILHHYWDQAGIFPTHSIFVQRFMKNLSLGVDLFFVLSGFLIYGILRREYEETGTFSFIHFFRNRILRIFPSYYIYLGISYILFRGMLKNSPIDSPGYASTMKWFYNLRFDFFYLGNYLGSSQAHLWSLAIEEQFYIILPFLATLLLFRLGNSSRLLIVSGLWISVLIIRIFCYLHFRPGDKEVFDTYFYTPLHTRFDGFLTGILAWEFLFEWNILSYLQNKLYKLLIYVFCLLSLPFCLFVKMEDSYFWYSTFRFSILNLNLLVFFVIAHSQKSYLYKLLSLPLFTPIARLSYGMYLWHIVGGAWGFSLFVKFKPALSWVEVLFGFFGILLGTVLFSFLNYCLIEYPFLQWKRKS